MTLDPSDVRCRLRHRGERIRRREVRRALRRLETLGPVSDDQRVAVETLATELVDGLLDPAEQRLGAAGTDADSVAAIARLYG